MKPSIPRAVDVFSQKVNKKSKFESKIILGASHSYVGYEDELAHIITDWIKRNY